jgi:preprotein translocase subunit SecG
VHFLTPYRGAFEVAQIVTSVALIICILLQARGAGLGSVFGGTGQVFKTRRGIDKLLFNSTVAFAVLFTIISFLAAAIPTS